LFPTVPADYLPCDGRVISISSHRPLYDVIGNTYNAGTGADGTTTFALPDLRGIFLRGMKAAGSILGAKHNWTTGRSRTAMTTSSNGDHKHYDGAFFHQPPNKYGTVSNNTTATVIANTGSNFAQQLTNTSTDGAHSHTINGGGDAETAPDHMYVNFVIRVVAIEGGAKGEKGDSGQDGDGWLVGDIKQSILTEAQFKAALPNNESTKWVLADGRDVSGSRYATITGRNSVPDLRGAFLRMAGQNATNASWNGGALNSYHEDTTRAPRNTAFTTSGGTHAHVIPRSRPTSLSAGWADVADRVMSGFSGGGRTDSVSNTNTDGSHSHTITGGDAESAPRHYSLNYFIRIG
jgi:microcystin-dependent protein